MFHAIEKFRTPAQILLGAVALSFVGFGLAGFELSRSNDYIVKVGDEIITQQQLDYAVRNTEQANGNSARQAVFQTLLDQAYLIEGAKQLGIVISDKQIKQSIVDNPQFHDSQQQFDPNLFKNFVQYNFGNEAAFMEQEHRRLTLSSLFKSLEQGVLSDSQIQQLMNLQLSPREIRIASIAPEHFANKVAVNDEALQKFYQAQKNQFTVPLAVKYEYVVLSPQMLAEKQSVSDEEIQQEFENSQKNQQPKRRLAHILFNAPATADAETRAKAKAKAEKIHAEIMANPTQFAQFAKQYSEDSGSRDAGGDLGEFVKNGTLGSENLENAAFALKEGEISAVVESEFGYHIVRASASAIAQSDLQSQKAALIESIKQQKAYAAYNQLREQFGDAAFADSGSLKKAAESFKIALNQQDNWTDKAHATQNGTLPNAVAEVLFGEEMLQKKHNSEGINVNGETWFVRVVAVRPETTPALNEIKPQVEQAFIQSESARLAREQSEKWLQMLREGKKIDVAWSEIQTINPQLLRAPLGAEFGTFMQAIPKNQQPAYALLFQGATPQLVEVMRIVPVSEADLVQSRQVAAQIQGERMMEAYLRHLKSQIKTSQGNQTLDNS